MPPDHLLYVVQSVPSRRELRQRLLVQIPQALVVEDDGHSPPNPWRGYQLCLRAFLETGASHGCILQDDTVVCQNFEPAVQRICEIHPDVPICLFVSGFRNKTWKSYTRAVKEKRRYSPIWFQDFLPVVAVLWPRAKAEWMLEWSRDMKLPGGKIPRSDDAVVGSWMKFMRQTVLATVPSLVQHPDDTPSVKWNEPRPQSGKDRRRKAIWYIEDADPLVLDWGILWDPRRPEGGEISAG